jgi:UDP-N-acetylmuramoyl-L-alanyl-D-glutamate--2,6-diaminopimelate ligase
MRSLLSKLLPQKIKNYYHLVVSFLANIVYGFPSQKLKIIGVTGTDGKTTTSTMLYHILKENGKKVGLVSTVSAKIGRDELPTGLHVTTPDPFLLQKILRQMVDKKMEYVVLEITSHGLDQYRVSGVDLVGGVYTNVTPEHLDYHKTYKSYLLAKAKMMKLVEDGGFVVLNVDDRSYSKLSKISKNFYVKVVTYGQDRAADLMFKNYKPISGKGIFDLIYREDKIHVTLPLLGLFNAYNFSASVLAAMQLSVSMKKASESMNNFPGVTGRWNVIKNKPFKVVVDFAHTPNALEVVLKAARKVTKGNLISVFGCAGLRDPSKRDQMGKIAGDIADMTIATAEDPRTEKLADINNKIEKGWRSADIKGKKFFRFDDESGNVKVRRDAIKKAVKLAKPGDTIIITGKGHEESLCFGTKEYPWNDITEVKKILNEV